MKKNILYLISIILIAIQITGCNKTFEIKNTGKYANYIGEVKTTRKKELKSIKNINETYAINYENVIYEKEASKEELLALKNSSPIATYIICIADSHETSNGEIKNECNFYSCIITKNNFRQIIKNQLNINSIGDIDGILNAGKSGSKTAESIDNVYESIKPQNEDSKLGDISSVAGFIIGAGSKLFENIKKGNSDVDDFINELPNDVYKNTFTEYSKDYAPEIKKINRIENLSNYFNESEMKIIKSVVNKYSK